MIVKLLKSGESGWIMFDRIRKINKVEEEYDFDPNVHPVDKSEYIKGSNYRLFDTYNKLVSAKSDGCKVAIITFLCTLDNSDEYAISFDTVAYICNDEGKTIEKVVANI